MNVRRMPPPVDMDDLALQAPRTVHLRRLHDLLMTRDAPEPTQALADLMGWRRRYTRDALSSLEDLDLAVSWGPNDHRRRWTGVRREPLDLIPVAVTMKPVLCLLVRWTETQRVGLAIGQPSNIARKRLRLEAQRDVLEHDPDNDRWRLAAAYRTEVF